MVTVDARPKVAPESLAEHAFNALNENDYGQYDARGAAIYRSDIVPYVCDGHASAFV
jgi:hypothetical protein